MPRIHHLWINVTKQCLTALFLSHRVHISHVQTLCLCQLAAWLNSDRAIHDNNLPQPVSTSHLDFAMFAQEPLKRIVSYIFAKSTSVRPVKSCIFSKLLFQQVVKKMLSNKG